MKINGTDAANVITVAPIEQSIETRREFKTETKEELPKMEVENINVNISNLSSVEKKELPISEKVLIAAIEKANKAISGGNRRFEFSIHQKTKEIMIKVIDADTNEIVREIPPEKTLDMVAKMWEMAGIIVDERR